LIARSWNGSRRNCALSSPRKAGTCSAPTRRPLRRWPPNGRGRGPRTCWPGSRRAGPMRLRRLDLTRYGRFTDFSLDFGAAEPGVPDLHLVYGPNEAGKSTALAAFLDLLYGIDGRSRYNFLHPHSSMRIGAALELGSGTHELIRIKRAQGSLLDASERPVPEALVAGDLAGIDRDAYRTMFSLDDETLEKGGDSILASKGDLGQLL